MDPFELLGTEEEVDKKLNELTENGDDITDEIRQQAARRKIQIQSHNGM